MEEFLLSLNSFDPLLVYALVFGFAFLENLFPPSPSDLVIVAGGTLVGIEHVGFVPMLACATAGSVGGFLVMYKAGAWFGVSIVERGKLRYLPIEAIRKVEAWFARYGYWVVVVNRFLTGTRAVVSFFAGMSGLLFGRTTLLCTISALVWNSILIWGGWTVGRNWQLIGFYLGTYSQAVTALLILVAIVLVIRYFRNRKSNDSQRPGQPVQASTDTPSERAWISPTLDRARSTR